MVGKFILDSDLINESFDTDHINLTTSFDLEKIGKSRSSKFFIVYSILAKTTKALFKKNYDMCYMTITAKGVGFYKDFLVVLLLKLFGKKIIFHLHNKGIKENRTNFLKRWLYSITFKNSKVILLAPQLYSDIANYVKKNDVYFCPNGMPDNGFEAKKKLLALADNGPCKFLFLSNMMLEKGVMTLLDACDILHKRELPFECHFVGAWSDVSEKEFCKRVNDNDLAEHIYAHGAIYGAEKLQFFQDCDVFVFPTFYHNEAFPLVNIEAMQQGLPIISTPEGGIPEMVLDGETGFLVGQNNVEALVEKMEVLIGNPRLRLKMGMAGRHLYEKHFTLSKFEQQMKHILEKASSAAPMN